MSDLNRDELDGQYYGAIEHAEERYRCKGCGHLLPEREFEHYENHPDQERLCLSCFKESRAR